MCARSCGARQTADPDRRVRASDTHTHTHTSRRRRRRRVLYPAGGAGRSGRTVACTRPSGSAADSRLPREIETRRRRRRRRWCAERRRRRPPPITVPPVPGDRVGGGRHAARTRTHTCRCRVDFVVGVLSSRQDEPPRQRAVLTDRSVVTALPSTTPRPVLKSSADDSETPHRLPQDRCVHR